MFIDMLTEQHHKCQI